MIDIITAIVALDPAAQVSVNGEDITWHDGNPNSITAAQIEEKQTALAAQAVTDAAAKVASKASAKSKLAAIGLSNEEISAAFGL